MGKRIDRLLKPQDAKLGVLFLDTLAWLHLHEEHPVAEKIGQDFETNKQVVAQLPPFRRARYGDLPRDAKSFISRCASLKAQNKLVPVRQIALEQFGLVQLQSDKLFEDVMGMIEKAADEIRWRRRIAQASAAWHEDAARDPFHAYPPEDIPHEYTHANPTDFRPWAK